ncbi:MAG TPA: hypothetical protein PK993_00315 [Clostridia bacterium]|nr:hypothetical protein [Clostridia bacterium]
MENYNRLQSKDETKILQDLQGHTFLNVAIQIITEIIAEFSIEGNNSALKELAFVRDEVLKNNPKYVTIILDKQRREKWIKTL